MAPILTIPLDAVSTNIDLVTVLVLFARSVRLTVRLRLDLGRFVSLAFHDQDPTSFKFSSIISQELVTHVIERGDNFDLSLSHATTELSYQVPVKIA